jgi:hypothetical protein
VTASGTGTEATETISVVVAVFERRRSPPVLRAFVARHPGLILDRELQRRRRRRVVALARDPRLAIATAEDAAVAWGDPVAVATGPPWLEDQARERAEELVGMKLETKGPRLDEATYALLKGEIVVERIDGGYVLKNRPPKPAAGDGPRLSLEYVVNLAAAVLGLGAWVAIVGGATMWARFDAAGVAPGQAIASLPREVLIQQGLRTLTLPLLLAGTVALAVIVLGHVPAGAWARDTLAWRSLLQVGVAAGIATVAAVGLFLWALLVSIDGPHALLVGFAFGIGIGVAVLVGMRAGARVRPVVLAAAAIAAGTAAAAYFAEAGRKHPQLETARVVRKNDTDVQGLLVARTGDAVFVASPDSRHNCEIVVVPGDDVKEVRIGGATDPKSRSCGDLRAGGAPTSTDGTTTQPTTSTGTTTTTTTRPTTTTEPTPEPSVLTETVVERRTRIIARPAGAIPLDRARTLYSIPVSSVSLPTRLVISDVTFEPDSAGPELPIHAIFAVTDTRGFFVRGASVFLRGLDYDEFTPIQREQPTGLEGVAEFDLVPTRKALSSGRTYLTVFVRARKLSERTLAGVSTRRLVRVRLTGR